MLCVWLLKLVEIHCHCVWTVGRMSDIATLFIYLASVQKNLVSSIVIFVLLSMLCEINNNRLSRQMLQLSIKMSLKLIPNVSLGNVYI